MRCGENVYSGEVEAVIYELPAVREKDELIAHCRQSLANYKIPRRVEFSEAELPKDGAGKILRRVLRERFWANQERDVG